MSADYPFPPLTHEPRIQELSDRLRKRGRAPFQLPLAVKRNETDLLRSPCIRCSTCDGFPCLVDAKADADVNGIRPALEHSNVTLLQNAKVTRLLTEKSSREISAVEARIDGGAAQFFVATSWWSRRARSTPRYFCCAAPRTNIRMVSRTLPIRSGGITCDI